MVYLFYIITALLKFSSVENDDNHIVYDVEDVDPLMSSSSSLLLSSASSDIIGENG